MKKLLCAVLTMALLCGLAACGSKDEADSGASDDPNLGLWIATTGEMWGMSTEVADVFGDGFTIELKTGGKCAINVDGDKANGTWTLEDGAFTLKAGLMELEGTLESGRLTLEDVMGMGLTLIFIKEGSNPVASPDAGSTAEAAIEDDGPAGTETLSEAFAWWNGEWYGYWTVTSASGDFSDLKDGIWDCYAFIEVKPDGMGMMYIWDDEIEMASAEISVDESGGVGFMGSATAKGGIAFDVALNRADWVIMPTYEGYEDYWGAKWYDDYMEFEGTCETDDGSDMNYTIVLRPWGMKWDDIPADKRPPGYEGWYVGNGYYNWAFMLEALEDTTIDDEPIFIHPAFAGGGQTTGGGNAGGNTGGGAMLSGKYFEVDSLTDDGNYFEFFEDGTCVLYLAFVDFAMNGTYTVSGNTITFKSAEFDDTEPAIIDGDTITRGQDFDMSVYQKK